MKWFRVLNRSVKVYRGKIPKPMPGEYVGRSGKVYFSARSGTNGIKNLLTSLTADGKP
jgi:hypothetical protein